MASRRSPAVGLNTAAAGKDPSPSTVGPSSLPVVVPSTATVVARNDAASPPPSSPPPLPHWFVVFYALIKDTDGRDKALKAIQYGLRYVRWLMKQQPQATTQLLHTALSLHRAVGAPLGEPPQAKTAVASTTTSPLSSSSVPGLLMPLSAVDFLLSQLTSRMDGLTAVIGATRKTIRLFKWCYTVPIAWKNFHRWRAECRQLAAFYAKSPSASAAPPLQALHLPGLPPLPLLSTVELSNNALAILTDISEDVDFYTKQRLLPERWNATAARTTIVLWFVTVVVDLALTTRSATVQLEEHRQVQRRLERERKEGGGGGVSSGSSGSSESAVELERRLAASQSLLFNTSLTWLKFFFDFGVALPSFYQQQTQREGLVQAMGCLSALVATYKLILAVK